MTAVAVFWLSRLDADSSYLGSLLAPLLLVGASIGVTFVPLTLAATMGVPPAESGLASGLLNTSRQVGGALGLAVLATIATTATHRAAGQGATHLAALTHGYTRGFLVIAALSVLGAVCAAFLAPARPARAQAERHPAKASSSRWPSNAPARQGRADLREQRDRRSRKRVEYR